MSRKRIPQIRKAAYHEAGHVILNILSETFFKFVTVIPDETSSGHVERRRKQGNLETRCMVSLAGPLAEWILTRGSTSPG
jgi:ATP-dependent Zn protease